MTILLFFATPFEAEVCVIYPRLVKNPSDPSLGLTTEGLLVHCLFMILQGTFFPAVVYVVSIMRWFAFGFRGFFLILELSS